MLEFMKDQVPGEDNENGNTYFGNNENAYASENSAMTKTAYFLLAIGGTMASTSATCSSEVIFQLIGFEKESFGAPFFISHSNKCINI
jgi:hypothetical protein